MTKDEIDFEAEVSDNEVHHHGAFFSKIQNGKDGLLSRLTGKIDILEFPASPDEVGDWQEGDQLKITVENLDR